MMVKNYVSQVKRETPEQSIVPGQNHKECAA